MKELFDDNFKSEISNGVTLVEFNSQSGATCKLKGPFLKDKIQDLNDINIAYINFDEASHILDEYNLLVSPTFILFENGIEIKRKEGFVSIGQIKNMIKKEN